MYKLHVMKEADIFEQHARPMVDVCFCCDKQTDFLTLCCAVECVTRHLVCRRATLIEAGNICGLIKCKNQ